MILAVQPDTLVRVKQKNPLEYIHGGSDGALFVAWDFLVKYARKELVEVYFGI